MEIGKSSLEIMGVTNQVNTKSFGVASTRINGLFVINRKPKFDERGFFSRFFCAEEFISLGLTKNIKQINHSLSKKKGAFRGLHFQYSPRAEIKIVSCLKGGVFDIAVDIRRGSPTFLQWHGEILSADNHKALYIPEGFAHGFQALADNAELFYLVTGNYSAAHESGLNVNDPRIGITLPVEITAMSKKDADCAFIDDKFTGI